MNQRHEERYQRAIARITSEHRERALARALQELGLNVMPKLYHEQEPVQKLVAMKLGVRYGY